MSIHSAIWIDHEQARVFNFLPEQVAETVINLPSHAHFHRHSKGAGEGHQHPSDAQHYFHEVARAVKDSGAILILGPSSAKLDLMRHLHRHDPAVEAKVVGVETVDHPTDPQIVAYARTYFRRTDPLR